MLLKYLFIIENSVFKKCLYFGQSVIDLEITKARVKAAKELHAIEEKALNEFYDYYKIEFQRTLVIGMCIRIIMNQKCHFYRRTEDLSTYTLYEH